MGPGISGRGASVPAFDQSICLALLPHHDFITELAGVISCRDLTRAEKLSPNR